MSTQVNGHGLRSANNIQRARQRDNPGNKQKVRNQTTRQHGKTRLKLQKETETRSCVISAACDYDSWVISAMGYGKCSPV